VGAGIAIPSRAGSTMSQRRATPGDLLLHPGSICALVLLVANDHLFKGSDMPKVLTGKLSDVAGLVLLPLVLTASWEWAAEASRKVSASSRIRAVGVATVISVIAFTALQVSSVASGIYARMLGLLQWVPGAGLALIEGQRSPPVPVPQHVGDPGDLITLPACLLAIWIVRRIDRRQVAAERSNRTAASGHVVAQAISAPEGVEPRTF
jgi:hypothetical protein